MSQFQALDTNQLAELLTKHYAEYKRLLLEGTKEEFENCKASIAQLQLELSSRLRTSENQ